jgi:general secretion pathway protein M
MNHAADTATPTTALTALRKRATAWWGALAVRERRLLGVAAGVLGLMLVWWLAVQPAWRTVARAPAERALLDAQWHAMQGLAAEAEALRSAPPVNAEQAAAALRAATARLGDKGRLALQGDRAVLTLTGVGAQQLTAWLAEARSGARAQPLEAKLAHAAQGYSGMLVLAVGGAP